MKKLNLSGTSFQSFRVISMIAQRKPVVVVVKTNPKNIPIKDESDLSISGLIDMMINPVGFNKVPEIRVRINNGSGLIPNRSNKKKKPMRSNAISR